MELTNDKCNDCPSNGSCCKNILEQKPRLNLGQALALWIGGFFNEEETLDEAYIKKLDGPDDVPTSERPDEED